MNFQTVMQYGSVARSVKTCERSQVLTWSHHLFVAPLSPAQQRKWLRLASRNKWSANELRAQITRQAVMDRIGQIECDARRLGKFATIVIDPPWELDVIQRDVTPNQVDLDYKKMSEEELLAFGADTLELYGRGRLPYIHVDDAKVRPMALRLLEA